MTLNKSNHPKIAFAKDPQLLTRSGSHHVFPPRIWSIMPLNSSIAHGTRSERDMNYKKILGQPSTTQLLTPLQQ